MLFEHIIHHNTKKIPVKNTFNCLLRILCHQKIEHVIDIQYNNCFFADFKFVFHSATVSLQTAPFFEHKLSCTLTPTDASIETTLDNKVRVYRDENKVTMLTQLVAKYPYIQKSKDFVQIPPKGQIKVPFQLTWEEKVLVIQPRMYSLGHEARQFVDNMFNKIHYLGHFKFTFEYTLFNFSIFDVQKLNSEDKKKCRAVVNIQKLNQMVFSNSYLLFFQSEIITNVQRCTNLAMLDAAFFFYQQLFYLKHRFMSIFITDHDQEIFWVLIMGYINLVVYFQQEIDKILQGLFIWAQAYIDNIICKARSFSDLLKKLRIQINIFFKYNISIKSTKSFLNYPNVGLQG